MSSLVINPIHADIVVRDMKASLQFYTEVLNYEVVEDAIVQGEVVQFLSHSTSKSMRLVFLSRNRRSTMVELIEFENAESSFTISASKGLQISLSYLVEDMRRALLHFEDKNLSPVSPVFQISLPKLGETQIVFFRDPSGYLIELVAPIDKAP